jgi:ABC-2 type transport system permease protein
MVKRILTLLRQDLTNALRDNMVLYAMVGPLILVVGTRFFLPTLDQSALTFAVQEGVPAEVVERLEAHGNVQLFPSEDAVRARVARNDDVPGLVPAHGGYRLILEGNEAQGPAALQRLIAQIIGGEAVAEYTVTTRGARSLITEYMTILWIMIVTLLGGMIMAFNIVQDKETRAIQALGVSPLSLLELTLARSLFAVLLSLVLVVATTLILLGTTVNYGLLLLGYLMCASVSVLLGYIVGGLADSQLKAIAVLKFTMAIFLTLPMVSILVPRKWHVFWYALPNYWMFAVFENLFIGQMGRVGFWGAGLITLAMSLAAVAILAPRLRRQLRLR